MWLAWGVMALVWSDPLPAVTNDAAYWAQKEHTDRQKALPRTPAAQPEVLLLEVRINQQRLADVVRAEYGPGAVLLLPVEAWAAARLAPLAQTHTLSDGRLAYALDTLPSATYRLNRQNMSLEIEAPANAFVGSTLVLQGALATPPPRPQPGVLLNYDLSLQRGMGGGPLSGGVALEVVAFSQLGSWVSSALVRTDGTQRTAERLDSFWRYDMPGRLETLVLGDTVGAVGGWSRPVRYGGIRWARDFGMNPSFVTRPQPSLSGAAALPSTVELLVNNARRMSQPVPPGPFELTHLPVVTGAGVLNLVVRDLLGRETVVQQRYYASPRLLAPGLNDFSLETGWLRTGYGQDNHYGDFFGAATWRRGMSKRLTGEARVELQAARRAAGIELAGLVSDWAVGRVALATSSGSSPGANEQGQLLQLGIERNTPRGGGTLQFEQASRSFAPFGEVMGTPLAAAQRAHQRWLLGMGGALWGSLSGGLSYVSQTRWSGERTKNTTLSLDWSLWQRASLTLALNKRFDSDRAWRASLRISLPLEGGLVTGSRVEMGSDGLVTAALSAARNPPAGLGLGWRVDTSTQENQRASLGLQGSTSAMDWALDLAGDAAGRIATRAGVRGTLGLMADLPFASRAVGQGSFAVVDVGGLAGVPIKRSHQVVAKTDSRGLAFVPGLLPWQENQIEIDPVDLPLDMAVGQTVQQVTPYPGSGSVVVFAVRRTRQALVVLQQSDGTSIPLGAQVRLLPDGPEFVAGRRGEVWLTDLAAGHQALRVRWAGGGCKLVLTVPEGDGTPAKIGPLTCSKD